MSENDDNKSNVKKCLKLLHCFCGISSNEVFSIGLSERKANALFYKKLLRKLSERLFKAMSLPCLHRIQIFTVN